MKNPCFFLTSSGKTLLEIILVLSIIAASVTFGVQRFSGTRERSLQRSASEVLEVLSDATRTYLHETKIAPETLTWSSLKTGLIDRGFLREDLLNSKFCYEIQPFVADAIYSGYGKGINFYAKIKRGNTCDTNPGAGFKVFFDKPRSYDRKWLPELGSMSAHSGWRERSVDDSYSYSTTVF